MAENVKTFALCSNHRKLLAHMDAMQKAALLDALFAYNDGDDTHPNDPLVDTVFMVMVESIERMRKFSEQKKLNGMNGGRPKTKDNQDKPNETKDNQDKPKQTPISESESIKEEKTTSSCQNPDFDAPGDEQETPHEDRYPRCPQEKVLALYRQLLPELPQPRAIRKNTATMVRARWIEKCREKGFTTEEEGLTYFSNLFEYIGGNDFLTGRKNSGGRKWRCDYAWIMKAANFDKITNGYYEEAS